MELPDVLHRYLNAGVKESNSDDDNRKIFIVNLFVLVGIILTFLMSLSAAANDEHVLAFMLISASVIFCLGHIHQRKTGKYKLSARAVLFSLMALMLYLVYSGGVANTGPLWIFMVAPVALFLDGLKRGLTDIIGFTICVIVMMFYPNEALLATSYSYEFKTRLLYSFCTVTFLSAFYEYSRQQSYQFMLDLSNKYQQLAKIDPLTKLSNRRDAKDKLLYEVRRIERNKSSIAIIMCDIDHFKNINDVHGHDAGDKVLCELAQLFNDAVRKQDTVARWGGEEFLFILPNTTASQAQVVANKIRERASEFLIEHAEATLNISVSLGISELTPQNTDIEQAISTADKFLYQAKASGRNCVYPLSPASNNEINIEESA